MRPRLGGDAALGALLDAVVADRRGSVERVGDVLSRELLDEAGVERVADPQPCVAVRLQLDTDLAALRAGVPVGAPQHAGQVLDVVAVLVREHVRLGERAAARAELGLELIEEAEVDVDVAVVRAVERPDRRRRRAATGLDAAVEEPRPRRLVVPQGAGPVRLDAVDDADDPAVLAGVRVLAGSALVLDLLGRLPGPDLLPLERSEVAEPSAAAQEEERDEDDDPDDPASAAERERRAAGNAASASPVVLDL